MKKTKTGVNPDGSDHFTYDFSDHPGMQDDDVTKHTHVLIITPDGINGTVSTADGTTYDLSDKWIAVATEHADEVAANIHTTALALGYTADQVPSVGPIQAARDAFLAAGWTPSA